jgi:hypothetical protein
MMDEAMRAMQNRINAMEVTNAVRAERDRHMDAALDDIKQALRDLTAEVRLLKETKDKTSGSFRVVVFVSSIVLAGITSAAVAFIK